MEFTLLLLCCLTVVSSAQAAQFTFIPNACIENNNNQVLTGVTLKQCHDACLEVQTFPCRAYEYNKMSGTCQMTVLNSESSAFNNPCHVSGWDYYERITMPAAQFTFIPEACIAGNNDKVISGVSLEKCHDACLDAHDLPCRAFEYKSGTCQMTKLQSDSSAFNSPCHASGWDYYEKITRPAAPFTFIPNACIKGNNIQVLSGVSLKQCHDACLNTQSFSCGSFEYHKSTKGCHLHVLQSDSGAFSNPCYTSGWDYYEKKTCQ